MSACDKYIVICCIKLFYFLAIDIILLKKLHINVKLLYAV